MGTEETVGSEIDKLLKPGMTFNDIYNAKQRMTNNVMNYYLGILAGKALLNRKNRITFAPAPAITGTVKNT